MGEETGEMLRRARKALGLRLRDVSAAVGVSTAHVSDVELGRRRLTEAHRTAWAHAVGLDPARVRRALLNEHPMYRQGAAEERARIVAWLRCRAVAGHGAWYANTAGRIEAGEHMPEKGEEEYLDAIEDDRHQQRARAEAAEAERDALAAELAAMRGEAAPEGWRYDAGLQCWHYGDPLAWVRCSAVYWIPDGGIRWYGGGGRPRFADRLTGPDGAFAQAERAAGLGADTDGGPE